MTINYLPLFFYPEHSKTVKTTVLTPFRLDVLKPKVSPLIVQMNVISCGGNCRRLTLAISLIVTLYLVFLHRDEEIEFLQNKSCRLPDRVVFLKTHKTASSTIQNILMRWGTKVSTFFLSKISFKFFVWKTVKGSPNLIFAT